MKPANQYISKCIAKKKFIDLYTIDMYMFVSIYFIHSVVGCWLSAVRAINCRLLAYVGVITEIYVSYISQTFIENSIIQATRK